MRRWLTEESVDGTSHSSEGGKVVEVLVVEASDEWQHHVKAAPQRHAGEHQPHEEARVEEGEEDEEVEEESSRSLPHAPLEQCDCHPSCNFSPEKVSVAR